MSVRVVRVLQYSYPDHETAEADMARWGIPPNGSYVGGLRRPEDESRRVYTIRSAVIPPHTVKDDDVPIPPEQKAWFENTGEPPFKHCPICGSAEVVRLAQGWDELKSIPIIGCGNPWHYTVPKAQSLGDPPPYDNPNLQHHPDDGHAHYFACVRCGVDNGINEAATAAAPGPLESAARMFLDGPSVGQGLGARLYAPSSWGAEVLAEAARPHAFEGSGPRCEKRACTLPVDAPVHTVKREPLKAMYVDAEMSVERPRDSRIAPHTFSGLETDCAYPGCGASDRAPIHRYGA